MNYMNMFSLKDKKAIITGAARGNGLAIAKGFLNAGAKVVLIDNDKFSLEKEYENFKEQGFPVFMMHVDLASISDIDKLIYSLRENHSDLSIIVNNAGITHSQSLDEYNLEKWEMTHKINLFAPFLLVKGLLELLKVNNKKNPSIINITSLNAELAFPDNPAYISSKGGLKQLSKSFAYDLGKYNIRSNCIGPGYIETNMTKKSFNDPEKHNLIRGKSILGRWGATDDLVGAAIFLASDASLYITGQDLYIDGGWLIKGI
jgi:gluconate 5-dehydrogenase